jgi:hypothetical protein
LAGQSKRSPAKGSPSKTNIGKEAAAADSNDVIMEDQDAGGDSGASSVTGDGVAPSVTGDDEGVVNASPGQIFQLCSTRLKRKCFGTDCTYDSQFLSKNFFRLIFVLKFWVKTLSKRQFLIHLTELERYKKEHKKLKLCTEI